MKTIIFVCHGNICRSPAAEWIMKYLVSKYGIEDKFFIYSRATSLEEIGNDIYPPMKRALSHHDIPFEHSQATRITKEDYEKADYIFYMDHNNLSFLKYLMDDPKKKFHPISMFTKTIDQIDDPWYSGEYDIVINEIFECVEDIIKNLL